MNIRPIRNDADHAAALARMEALWRSAPGSDEAAELDAIATLVDAYESRLVSVPPGEPHEVLKYAIDEMGRSEQHLAEIFGSRLLASQTLSGERPMTLEMIRAVVAAWRIPAELLIGARIVQNPATADAG